jgi:hypothetical protein
VFSLNLLIFLLLLLPVVEFEISYLMLFSRADDAAKCLCPLLLCCAGYSSLVVQMCICRF